MKRGAIRIKDSTFVGFWIPKQLVKLLDQGVDESDSDRSKFIRGAVREKLALKKFGKAGAK